MEGIVQGTPQAVDAPIRRAQNDAANQALAWGRPCPGDGRLTRDLRNEGRGVRLADQATTTPETRPLVPYLKLGDTREQDYLFGNKCKGCGAIYLGVRESCGKCSSQGPFEEVKLARDGEIHVCVDHPPGDAVREGAVHRRPSST